MILSYGHRGMDLVSRVAYRFLRAEQLTKQWLMAVRRGWLTLMSPSISSWEDVFKAVKKLRTFSDNLREQIEYVRRGVKQVGDDAFRAKLDQEFKKLNEAIGEAMSRAQHWREVAESPEPVYRGTFKREDGEYMFARFRDHFEETIATSVPKKGGGGLARDASLTELMDRILKLLREDAAATQESTEPVPTEPILREFSVGNMKFILVMPEGARPSEAQRFAGVVNEAYAMVRNNKLTHLWYGLCFLSPHCEKLTEEEIRNYESYGYPRAYIECRAGWYRYRDDVIAFTGKPGSADGFLYGMIHELGHRHWYKFMSSAQRARFADMVQVRTTKPKLENAHLFSDSDLNGLKASVRKEIETGEVYVNQARKKQKVTPTLALDWIKKRMAPWFGKDLIGLPVVKRLERMDLTPEAATKASSYLNDVRDAAKNLERRANEANSMELDKTESWIDDIDQLLQVLSTSALIYIDYAAKLHNDIMEADPEVQAWLSGRVPAVTYYGGSNPEEAFAEAFAHYIMQKDMTRDQMESMRSVLAALAVTAAMARSAPPA